MNLREIYEQQKNFLAGVIMVALLALALFFSYQNKSKNTPSSQMPLYATFNKADGITTGSIVRLAGTSVGRVTNAQLDEFYRVRVTLMVPKDIKLPADTAAIIESDGLIGGKYIELLAGGDEEIMQAGDHFLYTQDVLLLDELLGRFLDIMRAKKGIVPTDLDEGV